ncbi:CAMK family protein kinase [Trichomonas vaginalis G3]|uniref:CAMK family protein kinase n=1 Tax=Trichomonas vaginalis (strain ATCC PRA-98 / G3) TaxID=412133 RepID=A2DAT9_TRIV3|nr:protein serine/threonine kinase protein [Trichomonas vaginalis G3]EAY22592.1 CAMK family protein kinase [Trichomonas vaginalis G3]KAI5497324.1 protein serine/threonine kinase protein [Trichomonas vaginalis G3]|eukprot:XP_001583578.1 CAMK family protein kinase [Trichomonas vaginalis G3]
MFQQTKTIGEYTLTTPTNKDYYIEYEAKKVNGQSYTAMEVIISRLCNFDYPQFLKIRNMIEILGSLSHPCIHSLANYKLDGEIAYLFFEKSQGNAFTLIQEKGQLPEPEAGLKFLSVIDAVKYLHENNIIHNDIRPENVIYIDRGFKLSNFMHAQYVDFDTVTKSYGTLNYQAPEFYIDRQTQYPKAADIWAMGLTLLFILTGKDPFIIPDDLSLKEKKDFLTQQIVESKIKIPEYLHPAAKNLISRMLESNPTKRITVNELDKDPWITSLRLEERRRLKAVSESHNSDLSRPKSDTFGYVTSKQLAPFKAKMLEFFISLGFKIKEISNTDYNIVHPFHRTVLTLKLIVDGNQINVQLNKLFCESENMWDKVTDLFPERVINAQD